MIRIKSLVCGSYIVRDADSNTLSVFNMMDGLASNGFPLLLQQFAAAAVLQRDPATDGPVHDGLFEFRLGDQVLASGTAAVNFEDKRIARQVVRVNGLLIPAPGTLEVRFTIGGESAVYGIEVDSMTPAQLQLLGGQGGA